jgi:adenylate cyclase
LLPFFAGNVEIRNSSMEGSPPLLTLAIPFVKNDFGEITHVALADIRIDRIQKIFSSKTERTIFLVDRDGHLIAHPDDHLAVTAYNMNYLPIVEKARLSKISKGQQLFKNPADEEMYIGAFSRTTHNATVIGQAMESTILEPARIARQKVFFITGLVLSGAVFFIFMFSISLTGPSKSF